MKKIYEKPVMKAIEINAEQTILTMSGGPRVGDGETDQLGENDYWD